MKFMKKAIVFSLFAIAGLNLATMNAYKGESSAERQYGYGYYGYPHDLPEFQATRAQTKEYRGHGWGVAGYPHDQPGHPANWQGMSIRERGTLPSKAQGWGWGVSGHPHSQPGHQQYEKWLRQQQAAQAPAGMPSKKAQGWGVAGYPHEQPGHPQYERWLQEQEAAQPRALPLSSVPMQASADMPPSYEQVMEESMQSSAPIPSVKSIE